MGVTSQAFSVGEFEEGRWSSLVFTIKKLEGLHHVNLASSLRKSRKTNFCGTESQTPLLHLLKLINIFFHSRIPYNRGILQYWSYDGLVQDRNLLTGEVTKTSFNHSNPLICTLANITYVTGGFQVTADQNS